MLGKLAVDLLSGFPDKLFGYPFGRRVGYKINSLSLAEEKALASNGAKQVRKGARPARPLGKLHHAIPHLFRRERRLEGIWLSREIRELRMPRGVLREIEAGFFVGRQFVYRLPGPRTVTAFGVGNRRKYREGRFLSSFSNRNEQIHAQDRQEENNTRFHGRGAICSEGQPVLSVTHQYQYCPRQSLIEDERLFSKGAGRETVDSLLGCGLTATWPSVETPRGGVPTCRKVL